MIGGQALRPYLVGKPKPAKVLHGACLGGVRLRVEGCAWLLVYKQAADAALPQFVGQHQATRPAAADQDIG